MAIVISADYDHLDFETNSGVNRHMLKDAKARSDIESLQQKSGLSAYCLSPLPNLDEALYKIDDVEWEQGGFTSQGEQTTDKWIRTGLLDGDFLLHNPGQQRRYIIMKVDDSSGAYSYDSEWMSTDATDEWYYIPQREGYHIRIKQRYLQNSISITPDDNSIIIYRPASFVATDKDIARLEADVEAVETDVDTANANIAALQSDTVMLKNSVFDVVTPVLKGTAANGAWNQSNSGYSVFVKVTPGASYRIKAAKSYSGQMIGITNLTAFPPTGETTIQLSSQTGWDSAITLGANTVSSGTIPADVNYLYFYAGTNSYPTRALPVEVSIDAIDYSKALAKSVQGQCIELHSEIDGLTKNTRYGYFRNYTDITHTLQWQHKTYDDNGALVDSDYNIMAEIPNVGNVEVKMNRPDVKFRIYKSTSNTSSTATLIQDWSHYFYRYTPDATGHLHYYVVVALEDGGATTSGAFTAGRRGIKVYTYEDSGAVVKCPDSLYGKRVAVIGDSIVQGRVRKNDGDGTNHVQSKPWPYLIAEACGTEPADFGIGGAKVFGDTWTSIYSNRNAITGYDVVLVCAGTNDFTVQTTETDFKSAYADILVALKANNTTVIALTPTSRQTNTDKTITLAQYAQFVKDVALSANVGIIDLYALTESNTVFKANLLDKVHPNEIAQKIIADLVLNNMPE